MANHLAKCLSPYLLQHAHNPVDWYPWGPEALEKARRLDRPIFLSIGYAACHWCHVMAHESFEDPETAAILNSRFVSIKVDREQRPDLDGIYMSVVVALTGQGGWPMSIFLTPDLQPFYGGTYFPPTARHGLPAFNELLLAISKSWLDEREEISRSGRQLIARLTEQAHAQSVPGKFTTETLARATAGLIREYDWDHGGWGEAPKFPQPMTIEFLLRRNPIDSPDALRPGLHALQAMARGGMYDVVGGGFCRYSTDSDWHIPHFEKMLYDNAQLVRAYLHAWQLTGEPLYRRVVEESLEFVTREMLSPQGGFYSSLDADSQGEEGKFYAWTLDEIRSCLGEESEFFETAYGSLPAGNWEGKTILQRALDDTALADRYQLSPRQVADRLAACHSRLRSVRSKRVRPGTDDKVLTAWNGLMLSTFAEAGRVLANNRYLRVATRNAEFLLEGLRPDGKLHHTWREGQVGREVFLEDYAALILALLDLYQADFGERWFKNAVALAGEMLERFSDPAGGFFDTPADAEALFLRPKDLQDNATPSGNALAAEALFKLAAFTGRTEWQEYAEKTLDLVSEPAARYPTAFGRWLGAAYFGLGRVKQVAVIGDLKDRRTGALIREVRRNYRPDLVLAASAYPPSDQAPALLAGRPLVGGKPTAYVCEGFVCKLPVTSPKELSVQL